jgi:hypothetical protein
MFKKMFRRYTGRMEEDAKKVKAIKTKLNSGLNPEEWDDVIGLFMLPQVELGNATSRFTVDPASGITVKLFANVKTGELKSYYFGFVEKDK